MRVNRNHDITYRPLRAGVACFNPLAHRQGTIGLFATTDQRDRWIVSCYHVLCRLDLNEPFAAGEPIYQPSGDNPDEAVAHTVAGVASTEGGMDCAAALVVDDLKCINEVIGIGPLRRPEEPQLDDWVIKSGLRTGVTEGRIVDLRNGNAELRIEPCAGYGRPDERYELSSPGDSGAVWVRREDRVPVALHIAGNDPGQMEYARAIRLTMVLECLGLHFPDVDA